MTYKHNEPTNIEGVMGNIKTYLLLILVVAAGLVAQISFLGTAPETGSQTARNTQPQDATIDAPTISVSVAPVSTLSFASEKKAQPNSTKNDNPPPQDKSVNASQAQDQLGSRLQADSGQKPNSDQSNNRDGKKSSKKKHRRCLLFNSYFCFYR